MLERNLPNRSLSLPALPELKPRHGARNEVTGLYAIENRSRLGRPVARLAILCQFCRACRNRLLLQYSGQQVARSAADSSSTRRSLATGNLSEIRYRATSGVTAGSSYWNERAQIAISVLGAITCELVHSSPLSLAFTTASAWPSIDRRLGLPLSSARLPHRHRPSRRESP